MFNEFMYINSVFYLNFIRFTIINLQYFIWILSVFYLNFNLDFISILFGFYLFYYNKSSVFYLDFIHFTVINFDALFSVLSVFYPNFIHFTI
jgi:hypothetical protein